MQEIELENELNVKIMINGVPNITLMQQDVFDAFTNALELQINEFYKEQANS